MAPISARIEEEVSVSEYSLPEDLKCVPIRFMDDAGNIADQPPGRPVVQVVLRYDPEHHTNPRAPAAYSPVYALIDTGADRSHAPPDVIKSAGWPQTAISTTHGGTADEIAGTQHLGHLYFPEAAIQVETDILSAPLRNSSATEHLLIGMQLIQSGVLIMDFKKNIYRLYLG
jgi:predicted aspartyl protease